ncbi:20774_t:CDS:2 [Cetraspora pellucida]|uniref:Chitin synthase n=1 Tax=Cetraspora pellucida TaxID=1433469 RepID=A0A9N9B7C4_9GLOM|nr:20774_t:CDS:2 [Cetraspora pellucida]
MEQYNYTQSTQEQNYSDYDDSSTSIDVEHEHPKRHVNIKNLVLELPMPSDLLGNISRNDLKEFTHARYIACTSEPENFEENGFTLRQIETNPPRQTELFIMIPMCNEDKVLLSRTFHGVVKNITHLCARKRSKFWVYADKDGWKKVVVCIVADGRENIEKSSLAYLAALCVYQDGVVVGKVKDDTVNAHIFEYTTQISIDHSMNIKTGKDTEVVPIQILFCIKEKETKKINSYRWFFNAFCPVLRPNICILIDVGTEPDPNIAGACGEIVVEKGKGYIKLLNPIVAAQNFEYKMTNILDKPFESVFGYITTLPEAFSAYRYIALQNTINDKGEIEGPLASYFKGEISNVKKGRNIFSANMYLTRDRILCLELVTKRGCSWLLHYVKSSKAEINVPEDISGLINQRIRWLNGSFFASFYAIVHFYYIWRSNHSFGRKLFLLIEMLFQAYKLVFSCWRKQGDIEDEEKKLEKTVNHGTTHDVNSVYRDAIRAIRQQSYRERSITQDKYESPRRDFQSIMIMFFWLFSNSALVALIIIFGDKLAKDIYIAVILWSFTGLVAFKILGTLKYLILRLFKDSIVRSCKQRL